MANYSLVINSKFQPFSFERYIQPYQLYGQNYRDIENQYAELETKANIWDKLANEQTDSRAYQMYKTYANDLEKEAERLSKEGLNTSSRRNMLNMASRYSKEITPLENAYKARAEEIKEQTAGRANGIVYEGNAATSSLDRYLDNPAIKYNSANSKEGFQRVATAAAALQKKLRDYGRGKALDGFTRTWLQDHGYRDSEVYQAIHEIQGALQGDGNVRGNNVLNSILADEMNTAGVNTWGDKNARLDYFNRIAPALYQAVGQTNVGVYEDKAALMKAQEAMQIRAEKRQAAREAAQAQQVNSLSVNPLNIYSKRELDKAEANFNNNIRRFSKYFYRDSQGRVRLTTEGLAEYRRNATPNVGASGSGGGTAALMNVETRMQGKKGFTPTPFKKFLDSIGGNMNMKSGSGWNSVRIGNLWDRYTKNSPISNSARYDASKVTEFDYRIDDSQQSAMKDAIIIANRGLNLPEVEYDSKTKTFKNTGKVVKLEDLNKNTYKVVSTRFSPYGSTAMIIDDKSNTIRVKMPSGINTTNEQNRDAMMSWATVLQNNKGGGTIRIPDDYAKLNNIPLGTTVVATPEQVAEEYNKTIQQAYLFHSQLGVQNKTKEQEYNPYGY